MKKIALLFSCLLTFSCATAFSGCDTIASFVEENLSSIADSIRDSISENLPSESGDDSSSDSSGGKVDWTDSETGLDFAPKAPSTRYGYQMLKKESKGKDFCDFYEDLYDVALKFHNSTRNVSLDEDGYYTLGELDYYQYGLTLDQATAVWKVFGDDYSIFYWSDIVFLYADSAEDDSATKDYGYIYPLIDPLYVSYADRLEANSAIQAKAKECATYVTEEMSDFEKALVIYDYIIDKIDYAYDEKGNVEEETWAYNLAGGAMYGLGVCECYAETYSYFCELFGLQCINVVGYADESLDKIDEYDGHAWNYLCLDGEWYAIDATWGDYSAQSILDPDMTSRGYFGMDPTEYASTHVADEPTAEWGIAYQCPLPTITKGLCPVRAGEEGEVPKLYASLDDAFKSMTNEGGRYEITLYADSQYTYETARLQVYADTAYIYDTRTLPKVAHITFKQQTRLVAEISALSPVTLQCDVTMSRINYTESDWVKGTYTILKLSVPV